MEISWIKITTDIFDDEKIVLIEQLPDHDSIIVIWFKLLALAGKANNNGIFMLNDKIPYTAEMLAAIFRRPLATVKLALETFENFGMIEIVNNIVTIPNWEKHQNVEGMDKIREQTKLRVQKYRMRQLEKISENDEVENPATDETENVTPSVTLQALHVTEQNKKENKNLEKKFKEEVEEEEIYSSTPSSNNVQNLAKEIYNVWKNNGLTKIDFFSFYSGDFNRAVSILRNKRIPLNERILIAAQNAVKVKNDPDGWIKHELNFSSFVNLDKFVLFMADDFNINDHIKFELLEERDKLKRKNPTQYVSEIMSKDPRYNDAIFDKFYYEWDSAGRPLDEDYFKWQAQIANGETA